MMGTGKSTIGKKLEKILHIPFIDLDELIEKELKTTISNIFEKYGETYFRKIESEILNHILTKKNNFILSTGGGIVLSAKNRKLLKNNGTIIWLDCNIEELVNRLQKSDNRPLLANKQELKKTLTNLMDKRKNLYKEIADIYVDTSNKNINEIIKILKYE